MRYRPEHKQASRATLVEASGTLAKAEGFAGTGLQALVGAAGVTTGAFYSQFGGKDELLKAIVEHELDRTLHWFEGKSPAQAWQVLAMYLSPQHVEHPGQGCAIPSLGAEIARSDAATRHAFQERLDRIHAAITQTLGDSDAAWAVVCQAVGAVVISRAMGSPSKRKEVLGAVLAHARPLFDRAADSAGPAPAHAPAKAAKYAKEAKELEAAEVAEAHKAEEKDGLDD